jgi:hypothetical protein
VKTAGAPHRRSDAAGASPIPMAPAVPTLAEMEARVKRLEALMGEKADMEDIDSWLYSVESIAEFKHAIRRLAVFGDKGPLTVYTNKTNGRVPHLSETRRAEEGR